MATSVGAWAGIDCTADWASTRLYPSAAHALTTSLSASSARLADGSNTYLYGVTRIGEKQTGGWPYYLGEALGSVRQLANAGAAVTLARSYEPFGDTLTSSGAAATVMQFKGEQRDGTGLKRPEAMAEGRRRKSHLRL